MPPAEPRDPRRVRFWGWIAFGVAIVIAIVYLLLGHPWNKHHSSPGSAAHAVVLMSLRPVGPGRYLSSTGELLDLTGGTVRYANIPLVRVGG